MNVDVAYSHQNGKTYRRVLLRHSYREGGKVKHRTIANLSKCSEEEIAAIRMALKHKRELAKLHQRMEEEERQSVSTFQYKIQQGLSAGAVGVLYGLARELGITEALGDSRDGRLALYQVLARTIGQGSRLAAVRLAKSHAVCDLLELDNFDEDDLYQNLKWVCAHQKQIENKLFKKRYPGKKRPQLFLYDVTSSYLEGEQNELAAFGYNRDGKRGKRQIVIGLLCDADGWPLSVEVFAGNTADPKTFPSQVSKAGERFGNAAVTLVGDRGMIRGPQIKELAANGLHYITAITKPQIETLLKNNTLQMELFDQPLGEVREKDGQVRYILRRNPERAAQMGETRQSKLAKIEKLIETANRYLADHPRAAPSVQARQIEAKIKKLNLDGWVSLAAQERRVELRLDKERLQEESKLDGCYVIKTDLKPEQAGKEIVHDRYKSLAQVESAFRTCKTEHLELRPIFVRLEESTRAHVLIVMLSYLLRRELQHRWRKLNLTVEEGLDELASLCFNKTVIGDQGECNVLPRPREKVAELIELSGVTLPEVVPSRNIKVDTRKQLQKERKNN